MVVFLVTIYVLGLALTSAAVLRQQVAGRNTLFDAGVIALWPAYWIWFLISLFLNRTR